MYLARIFTENRMNTLLKIIVFSFLCSFALCYGESQRDVMEKAAKYYKEAGSFKLLFHSKVYVAAMDEWENTEGTLWVGPNNSFRLELPTLTMASNGKTLYKHSESNNQIVVETVGEKSSGQHPSQLLFSFLECKPLGMEESEGEGGKLLKLDLKPEKNLRQFTKLQVWLDAKSKAPVKMLTEDEAENRHVYEIKKIIPKQKFKDKLFSLNKIKGVEWVDLRG